jgi:two-component system response regulator MprA
MNSGLVMVVDDDPNLRRIYHDVLTANGYSVIAAKSGEECLALLHRTMPKVLVLDIMMPEMDGIETCRRARKMVGENVPILFLTAADSMETVRSCLEAGGDDYLMKQGSPTAVVERVNRLANINKGQLQRRRVRAAAEVRANMATFAGNAER